MNTKNSKGQVYYGIHFYPGVAEYQEPDKEPYRVFLNEDTLRGMDPTFTGRPVFVHHVDGVDGDVDVLKTVADGWVVESFFNAADGKHWVKFIVVSEKGERAIKQGMKLSNCYVPKSFAGGGLWNGVSYAKEITGGEYEHLAIVPNPRYEESVIMTPEQFKKYNESKVIELKRLSNNRKEEGMKISFFKKSKVENAIDIAEMSVVLPKSGREVSIAQLISDADKVKNEDPQLDPGGVAGMKKAFQEEDGDVKDKKKDGAWAGNPATTGNEGLADPAHKVKMHDGSYCNVAELVEKHKALHDELSAMKSSSEDQDMEYSESESIGNKEDEDQEAKKKALELAEHEDKEIKEKKKENEEDEKKEEKDEEKKEEKKKNEIEVKAKAKEKADRLRNAHLTANDEPVKIDMPQDMVARGVARYGSN